MLLHISSPRENTVGVFGKRAFEWVDFLDKSGGKYWQILPLNRSSDKKNWLEKT